MKQKMHGITGVGRLAAFLVSCIYVSAFGGIVPFVLDPTRDTRCEIVLPDEAIPAERTAANLLGRHLPKMLPGIEFPIVAESVAKSAKRIYVGSTKALAASGFNVAGWDSEEELVAARRKGLFVAGGRPRGTRYAAADFLESLGVIVAAEDTQISPRLDRLKWNRPDLRRRPAFRYRDVVTWIPGNLRRLNEFNKYNGRYAAGKEWGGYAAYGKYGDCHTFRAVSKEMPIDDPSLFACIGGKRCVPKKQGQKAPLCPSNPKTISFLLKSLEADVARSRRMDADGTMTRPLCYEISMDDALTPCECDNCRRIAEEEGCYTGVMLRLVNVLARRLAELDPEAKVSMLVYQLTLEFPKVTRPERNVLPRVCAHDNEWIVNVKAESVEPITSLHNGEFRTTFDAWSTSSHASGVWDYWEYYTKGDFPYVAPRTYVDNMRYYRTHGVENVLVEIIRPLVSFFAFKNWLALKLMDNPNADYETLADRFFGAYYGKAAKPMREYMAFLAAAVEAECACEPMGKRGVQTYAYMDVDFFRRVYGFLAAAEAAVADDPRSLRHVRTEYVAPDRALVRRDKKAFAAVLGMDRKTLFARMLRNETEYWKQMYVAGSDFLANAIQQTELFVAGESIDVPIPREVKGDSVFDYKFNAFKYSGVRVVEDADAIGGKAVEVLAGKNFKGEFHDGTLTMGVYNWSVEPDRRRGPTFKVPDIPQDEKYHLYYLGRAPLVGGSAIWLHKSWNFKFWPRDAYTMTPDYESDVYVSAKVTGPAYVKGSTSPNGVFVDRVIVAR